MKKILLLSDTHSYLDDKILRYAQEADEVWHAGDIGDAKVSDALKENSKVFRAVWGNIDGVTLRKEFPEVLNFYCEEIKVMIIHIGGYPNKYAPGIKDLLLKEKPKLFVSGHSHILKVINDKTLNMLHMNPGAIGKYGFHQKRTMLRFEIEKDTIQNLEVIEFEK